MPPVPPDQCSPYPASRTSTAASSQDDRKAATPPTGPHQRHGDRSAGDDDSAARRSWLVQSGFPIYVRYADLVAANVVQNWTTLLRLIDDEGFPPGVMIGPNTRAWRVDEVEQWLAARPSARKVIPPDAVHPRVRDKRRAAAEAQP
jgi:hypothetical protein